MVKRVILGRTGEEKVVDLVKAINDKVSAGHTRPAGTKVLDWDEDMIWSRSDGSIHSVRDIDEELEGAKGRIEDAEQSLADSQVRLDEAEQQIQTTQSGLDTLENQTLPAAVEALEQADAAAQQELATLDGKLVTAQQDLVTVGENIGQLETDLATESDAREQLASDVQGTFTELDTRLGAFATDEALAPIRQALTDAQDAVQAAQGVAQAANQAANAASQAALEAAGIAASKGRVIIQETEPVGEDRNAANIWIKPIPDNPDTEIEEKAITYVYLEGSNEWVPTSSDELAQAAQNALDAREAAQQAAQRAETAISNAAAAQAAASAAQQTADQATLDAADAHNAAIDAQERVQSAIRGGTNLVTNGDFEQGLLGWFISGTQAAEMEIIETPDARSGSRLLRIKPTAGNRYPRSDFVASDEGRTFYLQSWVRRRGTDVSGQIGFYVEGQKPDGSIVGKWASGRVSQSALPEDTWTKITGEITIETGVTMNRFCPWVAKSNGTFDFDDIFVVDITDARAAQVRADAAYAEAASKATPAEVTAAANAAEQAAKTAAAADAQAKADQAKADALAGAATDAASKAAAAEAAAIAAASADAKAKADKALADALAELTKARGEITAEIKASANGKNSVTLSTAAPSGVGVAVGDTWWQRDASNRVFGQWTWSGSAWTPTTIRSEVIANLDVNKLVVNDTATMSSAVIDKLWVDGIVGKAAAFNQISIASGNILVDPNGLNPALRNNVGGALWAWDDTGKYWKRPAVQGGTTQFNAYTNVGSVYDSNLLDPGAMYVISYEVWVDDVRPNTGGRAAIYYRRKDGTTAFVGDSTEEGGDSDLTDPILANQWNKVTRHWRAPDDVQSGGINFQIINGGYEATEVRIRNPFVGKQAASVMIEDGAVNAQKVNAESVGAAVGEFVEAEVGNLKATTGTIGEAVIDKIWADGISAKSVTASRVTVSSPTNLLPGVSEWGPEYPRNQDIDPWREFSLNTAYPAVYASGSGTRRVQQPVRFTAGTRYRFSVDVLASVVGTSFYWEFFSAASGGSRSVTFSDVSGSTSGGYAMSGPVLSTGGWNTFVGEGVANETADGYLTIWPNHSSGAPNTGHQWFRNPRITPMTGATLIEPGAITTEKLTVTSDMSAKIVNSMSVNTKRLVVTEDAILNHATLIGQTVVDDINVQGKLVGTGGVFTGTVDFANINVTGEVLADKISGEYLYGTVVEGGQFVTQGSGGDSIAISSSAFNGSPGLAVSGSWTTNYVKQPGIGPKFGGVAVSGGRGNDGFESSLEATPYQVTVQARGPLSTNSGDTVDTSDLTVRRDDILMRAGGATANVVKSVHLNADGVRLRSQNGISSGSEIVADDGQATLGFDSSSASRSLIVNGTGVWVRAGVDYYNLEPRRRASPFNMPSGWTVDGDNYAEYTITLGVCYWDGVLKSTGTLKSGWSTIGYLPAEARPRNGDQLRALPTSSGKTVLGKISASSGKIEIWVSQSASDIFMHFSPFTYLV